jgi:hypothetical protein
MLALSHSKTFKYCVTLCYLVLPYFIFGLSAVPALPHKVVLLIPCLCILKKRSFWKFKKYLDLPRFSKTGAEQKTQR